MSRCCLGAESASLCFFADEVSLLVSPACDFQHTLGQFPAKCYETEMKVTTSKSKAAVLCLKKIGSLTPDSWGVADPNSGVKVSRDPVHK